MRAELRMGEWMPAYSTVADQGIRFTIPGEPRSKQRPRLSRGHAYTPAETRQAEGLVRQVFNEATQGERPVFYSAPVGLQIRFILGSRRRRDIDNMVKLVQDALNKVAYEDDHLIHEIFADKIFTADKTSARTEVHIYRLTEVPNVGR